MFFRKKITTPWLKQFYKENKELQEKPQENKEKAMQITTITIVCRFPEEGSPLPFDVATIQTRDGDALLRYDEEGKLTLHFQSSIIATEHWMTGISTIFDIPLRLKLKKTKNYVTLE